MTYVSLSLSLSLSLRGALYYFSSLNNEIIHCYGFIPETLIYNSPIGFNLQDSQDTEAYQGFCASTF